ncbi:PREDICTED: uncharacterized protein LOC108769151 [Trachymyrmex cornetzi]|uniref:uncharacterized protein LOC108769151 n=1 Tax=Trachymyrmex cornetzi TaxID=471704 RepID=UPI00084F496A|nr:PREDICTED: uncharacterized protein LOC108769151 [Trachymyrmex cornetzi]
MGNLPQSRVNIPTRALEKCGIDYAGPFYYKERVRRNAQLRKCYVAIFVCMATKAVHIELAVDLTAEAFLNVFKRFTARRGCPADIFSDNGLNFVGAERELSKLTHLLQDKATQGKIMEYASCQSIKWHFIPPRAPHQGGLWEAAVKATKRHLVKMTKEAHLQWEELEIILIQCEREKPVEGIPANRLSRWQYVQQIKQQFWQRWSREYLHSLQQRNKWYASKSPIDVGQVVILMEDHAPPLSWNLGRIQELHPGEDGVTRTVTVRTPKGIYKRPITRLCILPIANEGREMSSQINPSDSG